MKKIKTAIVVGGLSLSGKGFLASALKDQAEGLGHIFEMGHEFRDLSTGRAEGFHPDVFKFVHEDMPKGEIAPVHVYKPVLDRAWQRHRPNLEKAQVAIFDGVVRTVDQWPLFRKNLAALWHGQSYRVCVIWLERPDEKCLENWRHRKGKGSTRPDDHAGEDVQLHRLKLARAAWKPLDEYFATGRSSASYLRFEIGAEKIEHRIDEVLDWVKRTPRIPPPAQHEFLRATHADHVISPFTEAGTPRAAAVA